MKKSSNAQPRECIGCGCTRTHPCYLKGGGHCSWARKGNPPKNQGKPIGVCSNCTYTIEHWDSVMADGKKQTEPFKSRGIT